MTAYYNEFDHGAAAWLRELIKRGHIADGVVDERSILDVSADDLLGFTQCHFFAGIGGWSYALRLAGWPDDRPVWTGSPPCQPFSSAGRQLGRDDERHLAPHFISLVGAARPPVLFGEQVASAAVFGGAAKSPKRGAAIAPEWAWIDDLSDRLEAAHYAVGASDIPAAGIGAPHIRQRTFFGAVRMADAYSERRNGFNALLREEQGSSVQTTGRSETGGVADTDSQGPQRHGRPVEQHGQEGREIEAGWRSEGGQHGGLADAENGGRQQGCQNDGWLRSGDKPQGEAGRSSVDGDVGHIKRPCPPHVGWADADWLFCRDGKWRPVIASFIEVAYGLSDRMVLCCDSINTNKGVQKEEIDGKTANTNSSEALPILRDTDGTPAFWRPAGGPSSVQPQGILRQGVHGESDGKGNLSEREPQPNESGQSSGPRVRELRGAGETARPPQGRKPFQQRPIELADIVPKLPQEIALAELHGRNLAAQELQALQSAVCEAGAVCHTPEQAASAWASLSQENQDWLRMGFDGAFVEVSFVPLSRNEPARVGRLRGYGNAIVPQAAAAFIGAFMEALQ